MYCRALVFVGVLIASRGPCLAQTYQVATSLARVEAKLALVIVRNLSMAGDFDTAQEILDRAVATFPDSPDVINGLGALQHDRGDYRLAERSYRTALSRSDPDNVVQRARVLNNLATFYLETNQPSKAQEVGEALQALPFQPIETVPSDAAIVLSTLAALRRATGDNFGAEPLYERSIEWWKRAGHADGMIAAVTTSLGNLHFETKQYTEARMLYEQAVGLMEASLGPDHPMLIRPLYGLAACECQAGNPSAAEPFARRATELARVHMGSQHPFTAKALELRAYVLRKLGRKREAASVEKEAKQIVHDNSERNLAGHTVDVRDLGRQKHGG